MIRRLHLVPIVLLATFLVPALRAQRTDPVRPIRTISTDGTNERVTIAGRATASAGQMQSSAFEIALQDPSGGIRIFSRVLEVPVREGDSLIATGTVKRYRGDLELVAIERDDRLGGEQGERVDADHDGDLKRLTGPLRHFEEHVRMARQKQHAETVGPVQLAAVDGDVLSSRPRIAGDHQAGGNIRPAVVLVVSRKRKLPREIHVAMHHLVHRRRHRLHGTVLACRLGCRMPPRPVAAARARRHQRGRGDGQAEGQGPPAVPYEPS